MAMEARTHGAIRVTGDRPFVHSGGEEWNRVHRSGEFITPSSGSAHCLLI